ncbi:MAG: hypothetical protein R3279_12555 [Putridiphycobacter sp.]|nr:hypothetical protein [Putridiphycobacter sp.]
MKLNFRAYFLTLLLLSFSSLMGNYSVALGIDLLAENSQVLNADNHLPDLEYFHSTTENAERGFIEFIEDSEEEDDEAEKSYRSVKKVLSSASQYSQNSINQLSTHSRVPVSFLAFFSREKWYVFIQVFRI